MNDTIDGAGVPLTEMLTASSFDEVAEAKAFQSEREESLPTAVSSSEILVLIRPQAALRAS